MARLPKQSDVFVGRREHGVFTVSKLPFGNVVRVLDEDVHERALNAAKRALRRSKSVGAGLHDDGRSSAKG